MQDPRAELSIERAGERLQSLLRRKDVRVRDVSDQSLTRVRLESSFEFRSLRRVVRDEPDEPPKSPRDIAPVLWSLKAEPDDPFVDEPRWTFEEPLSGQVTSCPTCLGKGNVPCPKCNGTTRATCESCSGSGRVVDAKNSSSICKFCKGEKHAPCRGCALGEVPCKDCDGTGEAYTVQQVLVRWNTRKDTRIVAEAPPELPLEREAFVTERVVRSEDGALSPEQLSSLDPPLRAALESLRAALAQSDDARVRSQTAVVERVPVFLVRFESGGREQRAHFVGAALEPFGLDVPVPRTTIALVATVLVLGATAALFASAVLQGR
jgi:hypothetical protein